MTLGGRLARAGLALAVLVAATGASAATPTTSTVDIDNFWAAYDAVQKIDDPAEQLATFKRLYVDKASPGLVAFMAARRCTPELYLKQIQSYPKFWTSVRPRTALAGSVTARLPPHIERFRALYPSLRPASITYSIGCLRSSGTTQGDKVLIGAELAFGDESIDVSELPERDRMRLTGYFRTQPSKGLVLLNMHELVHTQQPANIGDSLLAQTVLEGVAEFVAEQITGQRPPLPYFDYGPRHEAEIKARFKAEMNGPYDNWLYNGTDNPFGVGDLGYFVGYRICQAYYERAPDKTAAIKRMIELDIRDAAAVKAFVADSGYLG